MVIDWINVSRNFIDFLNMKIKSNPFIMLLLGLGLIILFSIANLKYGVIYQSSEDILKTLIQHDPTSISYIMVFEVRLPMILMAIMAGAGLAISGLLLQRVTQNPLACPSLSGVEYGTACCVILSYMLIPNISKV